MSVVGFDGYVVAPLVKGVAEMPAGSVALAVRLGDHVVSRTGEVAFFGDVPLAHAQAFASPGLLEVRLEAGLTGALG